MTEYSRRAKGHATVLATSGGIAPQILPFVPDQVKFYVYQASGATKVLDGYWDDDMGQGTGIYTITSGASAYTQAIASSGGVSTFQAGLSLQYGALQNVSTITKANPAVVTSSSNHGLVSGDVVVFQNVFQTSTTGMPQITSVPFTVTVTGATTFTIPWNTNQSNYTAYNSGTADYQATFKKVLYPYLYAPGVNIISSISTGTTTTVVTTNAHNFVVGQEVAFRIPEGWGTIELNSLPNLVIPGSPIYGYVVSVTDYNTVVVNIDSSSYTAFNNNQLVADVNGLLYPQIVAVGDVNTGGVQISSGSALYPPPFTRPISTTTVNTINGPAIQGAFFNNTSQGFIIGSTMLPASQSGQVVYWQAFLNDIG